MSDQTFLEGLIAGFRGDQTAYTGADLAARFQAILNRDVDALSKTCGPEPGFAQAFSEYLAISAYYGDQRAQRSNVRLMDHIDQGILILKAIGAPLTAARGYCLHPIFQLDDALVSEGMAFMQKHGMSEPVLFALEYRGIANAYLSQHAMPPKGIRLSPIPEVNMMLIADKVQNRKDFELHHKGTHPKSERLDAYFKEWLQFLGITEDVYEALIKEIGG